MEMAAIRRKGILESIPDFFQIIVAIVIGLILIAIAFEFFANQTQGTNIVISGNVDQVAERVAKYVTDCWNDHRQGLDSTSGVCSTVTIEEDNLVSENNMTKYIDCRTLPDNSCSPDDCSKCMSPKYPDDRQDDVKWSFDNSTQYMEISYLGADRAVKVSNTFAPASSK